MEITRRKRIAELLALGPATARDISAEVGASIDDVVADLRHVQRSLRRERRFHMEPSECLACGFALRSDKLKRPSRCPRCKSERLSEPSFWIEA